MIKIRIAAPADASQLADLAEQTFRAAFAAMNSRENMEQHCKTRFSEEIQKSEIVDPAMLTLLSLDEGVLCGFAQLRWGDEPDCVGGNKPCELHRLYVDENWHGKGVAQELMASSFTAAEERGSDCMWLGVWEKNPRAIAFYRKLNFSEVGDHVFLLGTDRQRDIIMARPVSPASV